MSMEDKTWKYWVKLFVIPGLLCSLIILCSYGVLSIGLTLHRMDLPRLLDFIIGPLRGILGMLPFATLGILPLSITGFVKVRSLDLIQWVIILLVSFGLYGTIAVIFGLIHKLIKTTRFKKYSMAFIIITIVILAFFLFVIGFATFVPT